MRRIQSASASGFLEDGRAGLEVARRYGLANSVCTRACVCVCLPKSLVTARMRMSLEDGDGRTRPGAIRDQERDSGTRRTERHQVNFFVGLFSRQIGSRPSALSSSDASQHSEIDR